MLLKDKIALVTGASRGIGRGIALQLGAAGATVYITGRKQKSLPSLTLPTLEDTAKEINKRGGQAVVVYCDHGDPDDVKRLFDQIKNDHYGRLDILVNNAFSAVDFLFKNPDKKFWEMDPSAWDELNNVGLKNHYICSVYAARMMVEKKSGLIVNISSIGGLWYHFNVAYGVGKEGLDRMSIDCAYELCKHNVACLSLWPGAVKTELVLETANQASELTDSQRKLLQYMCEHGESTEYSGKCVVHLASDVNVMEKSGHVWMTRDLGDFYGFTDIDGKSPKNLRSVRTLLEWVDYKKVASWIPDWIKIPAWIIHMTSQKF